MGNKKSLVTFHEDKSTQKLEASNRHQWASARDIILRSPLLAECMAMAETGFNCMYKDGEMIVDKDDVLPHKIRFSYVKLLIDKGLSTPKDDFTEEKSESTFLKDLETVALQLEEKEKADKFLSEQAEIEPACPDSEVTLHTNGAVEYSDD